MNYKYEITFVIFLIYLEGNWPNLQIPGKRCVSLKKKLQLCISVE